MNNQDIIKKLKEDLNERDFRGILLKFTEHFNLSGGKLLPGDPIVVRYRQEMNKLVTSLLVSGLINIADDLQYYIMLEDILGKRDHINQLVYDLLLITRYKVLNEAIKPIEKQNLTNYFEYLRDFYTRIHK
jgi:hypothetical protein